MAVYDWPDWLRHQSATLVVRDAQAATMGVFGAGDQVVSQPDSRWGWDIDFSVQPMELRTRVEALLIRLSGMRHRLRMPDFQLSTPAGTCRLQGVTIRAAVPQFATVLPLAGCGVTATLEMGDWLECFGQAFRVVDDAVANASGQMDVEVRHQAHAPIPAGTPVVLDSPRMICGLVEPSLALPRAYGVEQPAFTVRLIERPQGT